MLDRDARADVIAIQEAGAPPRGAPFFQEIHTADTRWVDDLGFVRSVREYRLGTGARPTGYLYWIHTDTNPDLPFGRVDVALFSRARVAPEDVHTTREAVIGDRWGSRPALGIDVDGVVYCSLRGSSGSSGSGVPRLLNIVRDQMAPTGLPWIALGDYNRGPVNLRTAVGAAFTVQARALPTHQTERVGAGPARVLDYAVLPTAQADASVIGIERFPLRSSDHYPVVHTLGNLPNAPTPTGSAEPVRPNQVFLRNAATTNVAGPADDTAHAVEGRPIDRSNPSPRVFSLTYDPEHPGYFRVFHPYAPFAGRYLGQEGGARDARTVLWPNAAPDQLWARAYQGDGTYTPVDHHTGQYLTDLGPGRGVVARDHTGEADQRWFLQDVLEGTDLTEIVAPDAGGPVPALAVDDLETVPYSVYLASDAPGSGSRRFSTVFAGPSGTCADCFHLIQGRRYVDSTAAHPQDPQSGDYVTVGDFRPDGDGFQWCKAGGGPNGTLLADFPSPFGHLDLTRSATTDVVAITRS
ncbi:hypothetical protein K353_03449, partial [Kitasatospora sp. SolWspMP-SS2h]|uniref:hypothetical protein n=1 Tax=Kitasatospora sp. SolWspMP-SS2h TaxID=1305729 RepID=UPI000DC0127E